MNSRSLKLELFALAIAVFSSAFLLFAVQPLISKILLPWFGGSTGVWAVCLVFFQTALCIGYGYAFCLQRWVPPKHQWKVHGVLLALGILCLPILPGEQWKPEDGNQPTIRILTILVGKILLPYLALSATGPLLQSWFARVADARQTYRLYALSNVGSLLSLIAFPFLFEPRFTGSGMSLAWSAGYIAFSILCLWLAYVNRLPPIASSENIDIATLDAALRSSAGKHQLPADAPSALMIASWIFLPAVASFFLVAGTNHLCQDVASIPFLWITPLSLYLLSFVICFDASRWYSRLAMTCLVLTGGYFAISLCGLDNDEELGKGWLIRAAMPVIHYPFEQLGWMNEKQLTTDWVSWLSSQTRWQPIEISFVGQIAVYSLIMFGTFMIAHGELVKLKPPTRFLTLYYLLISVGGALGGASVSLIAPQIFDDIYEWPIGLISIVFVVTAIGFLISSEDLQLNKFRWRTVFVILPTSLLLIVAIWQNSSVSKQIVSSIEIKNIEPMKSDASHENASTTVDDDSEATEDEESDGSSDAKVTARFATIDSIAAWLTVIMLAAGSLCLAFVRQLQSAIRWRRIVTSLHWILLSAFLWHDYAIVSGIASQLTEAMTERKSSRKPTEVIWQGRNFYGALTITERERLDRDNANKSIEELATVRILRHGRIAHGSQFRGSGEATTPTTYYIPESGIGQAIAYLDASKERRIGTIGLGTGTLLAYAKGGTVEEQSNITVYEINPLVVELSERKDPYFTYLYDARERGAAVEIVLGDARLMMERQESKRFDLLSVDAFSGDSIPTHLLTKEALKVYMRHLQPLGILAIHISNRYLDLEPVCRALAEEAALQVQVIEVSPGYNAVGFSSTWVLMTASSEFIEENDRPSHGARPITVRAPISWTDDFTNLVSILRNGPFDALVSDVNESDWYRRILISYPRLQLDSTSMQHIDDGITIAAGEMIDGNFAPKFSFRRVSDVTSVRPFDNKNANDWVEVR